MSWSHIKSEILVSAMATVGWKQ